MKAMSIGNNIRQLRQERGYSQKELAKVLNITPSCLCKYETDKAQIPPETLISIADVLNVSLDYLFGRNKLIFDYNTLNENYISKVKTYMILEDALSLNTTNRKLHFQLLKALKCQNDLEQLKIGEQKTTMF